MNRVLARSRRRLLVAAALAAVLSPPARAFDLQGHRGARGLMPENTIEGFRAALALGVTTLELDLGMTKDGVLVVHHDQALHAALARNGKGEYVAENVRILRQMTLKELKAYDVGRLKPGHSYGLAFLEQKEAAGARVPTLEEVFALVARPGAGHIRLNIETKITPRPDDKAPVPKVFAKAVVDLVRKHKLEKRVAIQSFDWRTLKEAQALAPEIARVCLSAEGRFDTIERGKPGASPWTAGLDVDAFGGSTAKLATAAGCSVWSPNFADLSEEKVAEARELGLSVIPWTVNEPYLMKRMLDWKVDGLITDYPDRARKVMAERGMALPAAVAE